MPARSPARLSSHPLSHRRPILAGSTQSAARRALADRFRRAGNYRRTIRSHRADPPIPVPAPPPGRDRRDIRGSAGQGFVLDKTSVANTRSPVRSSPHPQAVNRRARRDRGQTVPQVRNGLPQAPRYRDAWPRQTARQTAAFVFADDRRAI